MRLPENVHERIARHAVSGPNGCWLWRGAVGSNGYGKMGWRDDGAAVTHPAHRVAFVAWRGPIPSGAHLHHVCHERLCVNPFHAEPMAQSEHNGLHTRTHCKRGHLLAETARSNGPNARTCRVCHNDRRRERQAA